jgi:hypothetical protein
MGRKKETNPAGKENTPPDRQNRNVREVRRKLRLSVESTKDSPTEAEKAAARSFFDWLFTQTVVYAVRTEEAA